MYFGLFRLNFDNAYLSDKVSSIKKCFERLISGKRQRTQHHVLEEKLLLLLAATRCHHDRHHRHGGLSSGSPDRNRNDRRMGRHQGQFERPSNATM